MFLLINLDYFIIDLVSYFFYFNLIKYIHKKKLFKVRNSAW